MRVLTLIVLAGVALVSPAEAAPPGTVTVSQSQTLPLFSQLFRQPSTPRLMAPAPQAPRGPVAMPNAEAPARPPARVVCGMTMVPVDSSLDPKIVHPVPPSRVKHTIRISKPPLCGQP